MFGKPAFIYKLMSRSIGFDDLNAAMDRLADGKTIREVLVP
tara:strand:- start:1265 stop:1387 length:123 start_codon:yes stop_codon:yes gene_type:complete